MGLRVGGTAVSVRHIVVLFVLVLVLLFILSWRIPGHRVPQVCLYKKVDRPYRYALCQLSLGIHSGVGMERCPHTGHEYRFHNPS